MMSHDTAIREYTHWVTMASSQARFRVLRGPHEGIQLSGPLGPTVATLLVIQRLREEEAAVFRIQRKDGERLILKEPGISLKGTLI